MRPIEVAIVQEPGLGQESEAEVGLPILKSGPQALVATGYVLTEPFVVKTEKAAEDLTITYPAGAYSVESTGTMSAALSGGEGFVYVTFQAPNAVFVSNKTGQMVKRKKSFFSIRGNARPLLEWETTFMAYVQPVSTLPGRTLTCVADAAPAVGREIIYSGKRGTSITLLYRETFNDRTRPALTQELTYDLADGDEIGYRGARFKVLSATNTSIRFIALKPLAEEVP